MNSIREVLPMYHSEGTMQKHETHFHYFMMNKE